VEEKIYIFDTTLRDGEQSPGASMNLEEKLKLARQLEALQVDVMEAGFPIASDGDFEAVRQIAKEIRSVSIAGLARATELDIRRAWEALEIAAKPRIHTFIATSDIHLQYKLKRSREQVLEQVIKSSGWPVRCATMWSSQPRTPGEAIWTICVRSSRQRSTRALPLSTFPTRLAIAFRMSMETSSKCCASGCQTSRKPG
jgi:hypothetical protein